MKNETALVILDDIFKKEGIYKDKPLFIDLARTYRNALERQIPKNPKVLYKANDVSYQCPLCEIEIMKIDKDNCQWGHQQVYCECCGQKLDWD